MDFPLFSLRGKRALITGSSQGIGLALAKGLAEHGAAVILNGRDPGKIEVAAAELSAAGTQGLDGDLRRDLGGSRPERDRGDRSARARSTS